jgi:hypothetical protein
MELWVKDTENLMKIACLFFLSDVSVKFFQPKNLIL